MFGAEKTLQAAIREELAYANQVHEPFASPHEGYAVLLEEAEEAEEKLTEIKRDMRQLWDHIKGDSDEGAELYAEFIVREADDLCREAIQVAAMARKLVKAYEMRGV